MSVKIRASARQRRDRPVRFVHRQVLARPRLGRYRHAIEDHVCRSAQGGARSAFQQAQHQRNEFRRPRKLAVVRMPTTRKHHQPSLAVGLLGDGNFARFKLRQNVPVAQAIPA